ncbi:low molecular weight phosphotyrosine protein phosphatase [Marinihelvus fidelis]|uniref:protein-tyrosine-phosphatase n=1 Tax=Marinihelvus fidelis TaxID=2613842 RepID=A0A5N0TFC0_9GAMM|nr:low molecular weight protein-tyrosine-phosphatase [Marinihelvus fidelis]KAA9131949.1 low molecular weight phosphotyrosine protein phosphatase [Marinihelvus fidelis]
MTSVLFVCMGNVCRSPSAEGYFRHHVEAAGLEDEFDIDSAGTHGYHVGRPPDSRAITACARHGIDISSLSARQVSAADLQQYDHVLAMDTQNLAALRQLAGEHAGRVRLMLDYAPGQDRREVPDPYYGGDEGFELMCGLLDSATRGLLAALRAEGDG